MNDAKPVNAASPPPNAGIKHEQISEKDKKDISDKSISLFL